MKVIKYTKTEYLTEYLTEYVTEKEQIEQKEITEEEKLLLDLKKQSELKEITALAMVAYNYELKKKAEVGLGAREAEKRAETFENVALTSLGSGLKELEEEVADLKGRITLVEARAEEAERRAEEAERRTAANTKKICSAITALGSMTFPQDISK